MNNTTTITTTDNNDNNNNNDNDDNNNDNNDKVTKSKRQKRRMKQKQNATKGFAKKQKLYNPIDIDNNPTLPKQNAKKDSSKKQDNNYALHKACRESVTCITPALNDYVTNKNNLKTFETNQVENVTKRGEKLVKKLEAKL